MRERPCTSAGVRKMVYGAVCRIYRTRGNGTADYSPGLDTPIERRVHVAEYAEKMCDGGEMMRPN